ncbi:MAG TPA: hypothetical protein VMU78_06790, partial [Methylocella sp.]|nr:hypothetical protein [Methylocella sp.]
MDDVVANAHKQHPGNKMESAQMRRASECQPCILKRYHGGEQDKYLIEQHPRQQLKVGEPL